MPRVSIFFRYVFRQSAGALLLILLSLSGIVWIALALRELNVVTSQGQSAWTLLKMTTLALPNLMAIIAPVALLIAIVHTLNRLNGDSELIVLTASGANIWTVAAPLGVLALLVMIAISIVNHFAMPWSLRELRQAVLMVRTDLLTQVIQPGRFSSPEPGLTFHIRERGLDGELKGLIMNDSRKGDDARLGDNREKGQSQTYLAESGYIVKQDGTAYLLMKNGHVLRHSDPEEAAQILEFDQYVVDLDRFEPKSKEQMDLKPRERYFSELLHPEPGSTSYRKNPGQFRAELHERFANPLYPFAFVMIALLFVGQAQSTRQNRAELMAVAFLAAVACRLTGLALNNIVVLSEAAVPLLYAVPLVTTAVCAWLISRRRMPRDGAMVFDKARVLATALMARLPRRARAARVPAAGG